jgi:mono/diheme cytochrome c family protein
MKKFFKWLGLFLIGLVVLITVLVFVLARKAESMTAVKYDPKVEPVMIPNDPESVAAGEHWVKANCIGCHGPDLSGGYFFEAPFAVLDASNLTSGKGGVGAVYTDEDWVRSIRHGVNPGKRSLMIMPANYYWNFNDEDLGDIVAYLKSLPPVDKITRPPDFNLLGKAMAGAGIFGEQLIVAKNIRHDERPLSAPVGVTVDYGRYLLTATGCQDCHGQDLAGGKSADPAAKAAPNLTPGGELINWQVTDFIEAIRTGMTPDGKYLDPVQMPWNHYKYYSDDELSAIFVYLQSLPALETVVP